MICSRALLWIPFIFIATLLFFISYFGRIHVHFAETVEPKIVHIPKAKSNGEFQAMLVLIKSILLLVSPWFLFNQKVIFRIKL